MRYARTSASEAQGVTLIRARKHIHLLKPASHTDMQATTLYSMPMQASTRSLLETFIYKGDPYWKPLFIMVIFTRSLYEAPSYNGKPY